MFSEYPAWTFMFYCEPDSVESVWKFQRRVTLSLKIFLSAKPFFWLMNGQRKKKIKERKKEREKERKKREKERKKREKERKKREKKGRKNERKEDKWLINNSLLWKRIKREKDKEMKRETKSIFKENSILSNISSFIAFNKVSHTCKKKI